MDLRDITEIVRRFWALGVVSYWHSERKPLSVDFHRCCGGAERIPVFWNSIRALTLIASTEKLGYDRKLSAMAVCRVPQWHCSAYFV